MDALLAVAAALASVVLLQPACHPPPCSLPCALQLGCGRVEATLWVSGSCHCEKATDKAEARKWKHTSMSTTTGRRRGRGRSGVDADHVGYKGVLAGDNRVVDLKHRSGGRQEGKERN